MKKAPYILAIAFLLLCGQSRAAVTGLEIVDSCLSDNPDVVRACDYYLYGLGDEHHLLSGMVNANDNGYRTKSGICTQGINIVNKQMVMIVKNYMRNNPEKLSEEMPVIFHQAMHEKFPCQ